MADPALIRNLGVGQVAYIYRGGVTFVQVKRLLAAPAALPQAPPQASDQEVGAEPATARAEPHPRPVARTAMAPAGAGEKALAGTSPQAAALLDEAFGTEPG